MATAIKKSTPKTNKKNMEHEIAKKLEIALDSYKSILGEKKFKSRIKKASKLFLKGKPKEVAVKKVIPAVKKKAAVKAVKKSVPAKKISETRATKKPAPVKK